MHKIALLIIFVLMVFVVGCGANYKSVAFVNYPGFWKQANDYNYITVAPVTNDQYPGQYVSFASENIVSRLQNNNHYTIYDYSGSIDYDSLNEKEAELVVYTMINSYSLDRGMDRRTRTEQEKRINSETGEEYYVDIEVPYDYHWQESNANVTMRLYSSRVGGGELQFFTRNGTCTDSDSTPPRHHPNLYSPESMERCAIKDAIGSLVYEITPTYEQALLLPEDTLMVYQSIDNEWQKVSRVKEKYGEDFRVYIALPSKADMNDFVLEIVSNDGEKRVVKSWNVHWDRNYGRLYYSVNMYELYALSGGTTKLRLRLMSKLENGIVLENDFKLSFKDENVAKERMSSYLESVSVN